MRKLELIEPKILSSNKDEFAKEYMKNFATPSFLTKIYNHIIKKQVSHKGGKVKSLFDNVSPYYFDAKILIMGNNSILNALLLLEAAKKNIRVIYCPNYENYEDFWSYNFFNHSGFRTFVKEAVSFESKPYFIPEWGEEPTDNDKVKLWFDDFFNYIESEITRTGFSDLYTIKPWYDYALVKNFPSKTRLVSLVKKKEPLVKPENAELQNYCDMVFNAEIVRNLKHINFPKEENPSHLFCKRIVLTSFTKGLARSFKRYDYQNNMKIEYGAEKYFIQTLGSARMIPAEAEKAVEQAVYDILSFRRVMI